MNLIWKCTKCDSNCVCIESYDGIAISKEFAESKKPKKCMYGGAAKWSLVK